MKSSNPMLRDDVFDNTANTYALTERPMSVAGTMNKLLLLSVILLIGAAATYYQFSLKHYDYVMTLTWAGIIVSVICAIVISFKHTLVPYLSPVFAFAQGVALSAISCFFESVQNGIVMQAVSVTFVVVFTMALLYKMKVIRATERLRSIIVTATFSIFIFYLISIGLSFFGKNIAYFDPSNAYFYSPFAIGLNVVIALIAAFYLILDFDFIESGVRKSAPALYEWYGAFGLLTSIAWLYLEILRLLSRLSNR